MNNKQKKGFNQMMSILMLGLISAGGGVGVASFAQDQQGSLSATTGGAGLREAITIENIELRPNGGTFGSDRCINNSTPVPIGTEGCPSGTILLNAILVVRNVGTVDAFIGDVYFDGSLINQSSINEIDIGNGDGTVPGEAIVIELGTGFILTGGSQHQLKVTTEGGGVTTTSTTAPQR